MALSRLSVGMNELFSAGSGILSISFGFVESLAAEAESWKQSSGLITSEILRLPPIVVDDFGNPVWPRRSDEWREGTESISEILFLGAEFYLVLLYCRTKGAIAMIKTDLFDVYRDYIACLNKQDWPKLEQFVHDEVSYNGQRIGILGYREMLERDFYEIPDLYFDIQLLISDPPYIASRLEFDCTPKGKFLGLHVNGKRVSFTENVFYEFRREKIWQVWSVIDKAAIEAQL
jgi:predicted ester cyclase